MNLRAALPLVVAMVLGAALVIVSALYWLWSTIPRADGEPLVVAGSELKLVVGKGAVQEDTLFVEGFTDGRAIISVSRYLSDAAAYPYLGFDLQPGKLNEALPLFFWRRAGVQTLNVAPLESRPLGMLDLSKLDGWKGIITEFGFVLEESAGQTYRLKDLGLFPAGYLPGLRTMVAEWMELELWSQHSTHFLNGGVAAPRLSFTLLVGAWVLASIVIYLLLTRGKGFASGSGLLVIVLAGWLLLDGKWLYNLVLQANVTHEVFAGKTDAEKYLGSLDREYFAWFDRLQRDFLPETPARIIILQDAAAGQDYYRAKAQYFLAPHNVYNKPRYPLTGYQKTGGYIIILGVIDGLVYDVSKGELRWGKGQLLKAELLDRNRLGILLKIS